MAWWSGATPVLAPPRSRAPRRAGAPPLTLVERVKERIARHPVNKAHRPHIDAALHWLGAAQDASSDDGFARGYSIARHALFGRGWQPSYPETTGYLIPTLYVAARELGRDDLRERAERAARWEIAVQLPNGAVRAGVLGQAVAPAIFNTGQVMFGWLAAFEETGEAVFAEAACRAGEFLVSRLDTRGRWTIDSSPYANPTATLYTARTGWAMAEAGARLGRPQLSDAAACHLWMVARAQAMNGWIPNCCLSDAERPLLHTLAYAIRGLLEGARVLRDDRLMRHAVAGAEPLLALVRDDGWLPGRIAADWSPAVRWSCLTGNAQTANIWLRLYALTGDSGWLKPVDQVLRFLKATQNRSSSHPGVHGGIKGSAPVTGDYGRYEVLNWATKFFVDALLRDERRRAGDVDPQRDWATLA